MGVVSCHSIPMLSWLWADIRLYASPDVPVLGHLSAALFPPAFAFVSVSVLPP